MKKFTTIKVGYSKSIYGCANEYFTTIIINGNNTQSISHKGLYGSEDRINRALKDKGFEEFYTPSDFGLIPLRNVWRGFISEHEALELVKFINVRVKK